MTNDLLPCVEVNPAKTATASVIWLHGLGADGNDFANVVPELSLPNHLHIRFVFPHAPMRPVTINGGVTMRAWYDVLGLDFNAREDEAGVRESQQAIGKLIEAEKKRGIHSDHIFLGGFSQGGAIALHAGLRYPEKLAGILALSTYLPLPQTFTQEANKANKDTPIFMAHGLYDPLLPMQWGQASAEFLRKSGYPLEFHTYPMPHSVCADEIRDIATWLIQILNAPN